MKIKQWSIFLKKKIVYFNLLATVSGNNQNIQKKQIQETINIIRKNGAAVFNFKSFSFFGDSIRKQLKKYINLKQL